MPARYKLKRLAEQESYDSPPKHLKLEGAERQQAKKEARQGLQEARDYSDLQLRSEIAWEEEQRLAWACYEKEKADPNHVCTCHDPFKDI